MKGLVNILIIFIFSMTACQQNTETIEKEYLKSAIKEANFEGNYQWIVVLPGLGCHGCIQGAEVFMKDFITDKRVLFVLTKVTSIKILQQKIDIRINEHSNIFVDRDNLFDIPTDNRIYPFVIHLKDGKVLKHSFQNPQNDALYQLEQQLKLESNKKNIL